MNIFVHGTEIKRYYPGIMDTNKFCHSFELESCLMFSNFLDNQFKTEISTFYHIYLFKKYAFVIYVVYC